MPRLPRRRPSIAPTCPACGSDRARVVQRIESIREPDVQGDFKYEITECDACGEATLTFEQAESYSRAYASAVARARNALTPERMYELRMSLGWSQSQMEAAFGIGPKTWGRWERGTVPPSGPAARLLWIAENDRPAFRRMVDWHMHKPARHAKVIGTISQQGVGEPAVGFTFAKSVARNEGRSGVGSETPSNGETV